MQKFILAIDQGTTSTRAILFDTQGHIHGTAQQELTLHYPHNGWVEQDPEDIWQDTQFVCRGVLTQTRVLPSQIIAIGITN
ncbi:MAG: glycerol kinase, partial [Alphaproteobacteria bacterium]|nr:glycerol kinase [Alphaproteobacteria bacterium]